MPDMATGRMTFEEFQKLLAEILVTDESNITPKASFTQDLAVDSIQWVEMALSLQELGVHVPREAFWEFQTVGDAYDYYLKHYAADA